MAKREDMFSQEWQTTARAKGRYNTIAANVDKCVFCDLKEKYVVVEDSGMVLTVNLFPYIDGHLLIIPRRHLESYLELSQEEILASHRLTRKAFKLVGHVLKVRGFWLLLREGGGVGKTVKHFHWQVLPYGEKLVRWDYKKVTIPPALLAEKLRKEKID